VTSTFLQKKFVYIFLLLPRGLTPEIEMRMACHAARVIRQRHKADGSVDNEISPEQRKCLESAFEAADKNGDGILSADEYYEIFQSHGLSIDREWIERTIAQNDKDGDGGISLDEFIEMNIRGKMPD